MTKSATGDGDIPRSLPQLRDGSVDGGLFMTGHFDQRGLRYLPRYDVSEAKPERGAD